MGRKYDLALLAGYSVLKTTIKKIKESSVDRGNEKNRTLLYCSSCFQNNLGCYGYTYCAWLWNWLLPDQRIKRSKLAVIKLRVQAVLLPEINGTYASFVQTEVKKLQLNFVPRVLGLFVQRVSHFPRKHGLPVCANAWNSNGRKWLSHNGGLKLLKED